MKNLKLFENKTKWTDESFRQHIADHESLKTIISQYIYWKTDKDPNYDLIDVQNIYSTDTIPVIVSYAYPKKSKYYLISYYGTDGETEEYVVEEKEKSIFLDFLNNPDKHIKAKRFGL